MPRQFLEALAGLERQPFVQGSGRHELARAIASPDNPLTARVFVNRVWMHLFGEPMVDSPSDFGVRTQAPELVRVLDRLAYDFMRHGWSIKRLQRDIVSSRMYRQASLAKQTVLRHDPKNRWLTRMNRQRLDFEAMRDGLLAVCEDADYQMGGAPVDILGRPSSKRRTLYGYIDRQNLPGTFRTFDMASPDAHSPRRLPTVVPQQALFLMNGPLAAEGAGRLGRWAGALAKRSGQGAAVRELYQRVLARSADPEEIAMGLEFIRQWTSSDGVDGGWETYAQALLCSNEFMFID